MSKLYQPIESVSLPEGTETAVWGRWLQQLAKSHGADAPEMILLLHADDGVIWGRLVGDSLTTSSDAYEVVATPLRRKTVQQLRLFGAQGELLLWRTNNGMAGRVVTTDADTAVGQGNYYDENHLLWGEKTAESVKGFTLLREGARELLHAPPGTGQKAKLKVRHYIQCDATGQAYVALSRVVALEWTTANDGGDGNGS
jgi:CRISPR-associated protein (TIGR03984 family)